MDLVWVLTERVLATDGGAGSVILLVAGALALVSWGVRRRIERVASRPDNRAASRRGSDAR